MNKRKILFIGGMSFVSSAIQQRLAVSSEFEVLRASPKSTDATQLTAALTRCHAAVNCMTGSAAAIRGNGIALAKAIASCNNPDLRVVHLSSMTVYGSTTGVVNEDTPLLGNIGAYSAARVAAEQSLLAVTERTITLRIGVEYGRDSPHWSLRIARLLSQKRLGDLGADGDGYCNLIHVNDIALAVERALATPDACGYVFNLAQRDPPTWNTYLLSFALALRTVPLMRIGRRRLAVESRLLARPLKALEIFAQLLHMPILNIGPPITKSLLRSFEQEILLDSRRAERVLGMTWRNLDASLRDIAQSIGK